MGLEVIGDVPFYIEVDVVTEGGALTHVLNAGWFAWAEPYTSIAVKLGRKNEFKLCAFEIDQNAKFGRFIALIEAGYHTSKCIYSSTLPKQYLKTKPQCAAYLEDENQNMHWKQPTSIPPFWWAIVSRKWWWMSNVYCNIGPCSSNALPIWVYKTIFNNLFSWIENKCSNQFWGKSIFLTLL